jgi:hypothetical protein
MPGGDGELEIKAIKPIKESFTLKQYWVSFGNSIIQPNITSPILTTTRPQSGWERLFHHRLDAIRSRSLFSQLDDDDDVSRTGSWSS